MRRLHLLAAVAIACALALAGACGGDDGTNESETPTTTVAATATPDAGGPTTGDETEPPSETEDAGSGDGPTPAEDKTPIEDDEPAPTDDQPQNTDPPPTAAPSGIPATQIDDIVTWLAENYPGSSPPREDCVYNPGTLIVTCPGRGEYSPNPPPTGQDITCQALVVSGEPVALSCTSQVPLETHYYEIQG